MQNNLDNQNRPVGPLNQAAGPDNAGMSNLIRNRRRCGRSVGSRLFFAVFLIVAGILLFLDNIGFLPVRNLWNYWPLLLIAFGTAKLSFCRSVVQKVFSFLLIGWGALFLLMNLGVIHIRVHDETWPLSLLLITFGILALVKTLESGATARPRMGLPRAPLQGSEDALNEHVVFGSINRRLDTTNFQGGSIESIFGSVEIDLRRVQIASKEKSAVVAVNCVFGAVKIKLSDTWRVSLQAAGVLGNVEDKTIPPRTVSGLEPPVLIVTGQSVFGSVEVEN
jgi:predicted membrane protein